MDAVPVIRTLQEILESRQSRGGAWGFVADQDAVEPTCFVILALRHQPSVHVERASDALGNLQNKDGSWPAFRDDEPEGCWTTAPAVLSLMATQHDPGRVHRGMQWLLNARGREANWLWRWKLRTVDKNVQFDPGKFGWNWISAATQRGQRCGSRQLHPAWVRDLEEAIHVAVSRRNRSAPARARSAIRVRRDSSLKVQCVGVLVVISANGERSADDRESYLGIREEYSR